jgi:hypothetical protein
MRPATSKPARPAGSRRARIARRLYEGRSHCPQRRDRPRAASRAHHTTPVARRDLTSAAPSSGAVHARGGDDLNPGWLATGADVDHRD